MYDVALVIGYPPKDLELNCAKENTILITQEPPIKHYAWIKSSFDDFGHVLTLYNSSHKHVNNAYPLLPWLIDETYDHLLSKQGNPLNKQDQISWITSNKDFSNGHKDRLNFKNHIDSIGFNYHLYGKGFNPIYNKADALWSYKYTLAIENGSFYNYWTEKIADAFLTYTMPIYYGCPNILEYFPKGSFIPIDIQNPKEAILTIQKAINYDLYNKNLKKIIEARNLVLNKYSFFPAITEFITNTADITKKGNCYIPKNNWGKQNSSFLSTLYNKCKLITAK
ncbi:glycosyltransferase family 10 domain-containing protein [Anaerophaga thermohalophila]|uniref:glycosyltransferase family 10 domain-containing protein n=1 Tax=Anaerophaga thermohalophila TaxID=177400 RepID=UPI000237D39D|nr:glycosyltransferase family 10 [Anaerophaga thermohalophila]